MCYSYFSLLPVDTDIQLQEKLLSPQYQHLLPDASFLESFAGVVGSKWPSLANSLPLSDDEIENVKKEDISQSNDSRQQNCAFLMLRKWASRENATYSQLLQALKTMPLFPMEVSLQYQPLTGDYTCT